MFRTSEKKIKKQDRIYYSIQDKFFKQVLQGSYKNFLDLFEKKRVPCTMKNTIMFLLKLSFKKALLWNSSISDVRKPYLHPNIADLLCITLYVTECCKRQKVFPCCWSFQYAMQGNKGTVPKLYLDLYAPAAWHHSAHVGSENNLFIWTAYVQFCGAVWKMLKGQREGG